MFDKGGRGVRGEKKDERKKGEEFFVSYPEGNQQESPREGQELIGLP